MGMSNKAYARHRGLSPAAVRKALEYGRITKGPDGTIDPAKADRDWAANTIPSMSEKSTLTADPGLDPLSDEALDWVNGLLR